MKPHALCAALLPCVEEHRTCPIRVAAAGH